MSEKKTGLILEGGAMRGMFTCGVTDVFMENGIKFDGAAGISAGAVFGCNIKSGQNRRAIRYNMKYSKDSRYCSIWSLVTTGDMYGADFCYHKIPDELDLFDRETFKSDPMEFYVGATDVETGRAVFHRCSDGMSRDIEWFRASASMPIASQIVEVDGYKLLDGGIVCAVPYRFMQKRGYNRNVIILTQPKGFVKKKSALMPMIEMTMGKYPELVKAMRVRHEMYNKQMQEIAELEDNGTIVIRPPASLGISRTESDPAELRRVYLLGRKTGKKRLEEVREYLEK